VVERIDATRVVTPAGVIGPAGVIVEDGRIAGVEPLATAPDRTLVPGFVDLQVNGMDDVDCAAAAGADWERLDGLLAATGVTTWCPTLVTAPLDAFAAPLGRVAAAAERPGAHPRIAGAHLEGPFLCRPGAHPASLLRDPDLDWLRALPDIVRLVTLAAERRGAEDAARLLRSRGVVVAVGHTDGSHEQVQALADAGAILVTHLFNGMPGLHHRHPGPVGAALTDDRLVASVIADLVHVHPLVLALAFRAKPAGGVALVTDAVAWRAARVGGIEITHDGVAPRLPDGTLAGSSLTMDAAVRNVVTQAGVPLADAVRAASTTPADVLGLDDRGRIAPGALADLVALGPDLDLQATWVGGEEVHAA
jgi:N-acetylglucosamine-6-phosphate deacetylase